LLEAISNLGISNLGRSIPAHSRGWRNGVRQQ
jgi:hypothetical protein